MLYSRYYKKIDLENGYYALFNNLIREILFCSKKQLEKIELGEIGGEEQGILKDAGIIINRTEDDDALLYRYRQAIELEHTNIILVYIIPSLACNLKCDYCYIYNNNQNSYIETYMTEKVIDSFLDKYVLYLLQNKIEGATLQFYGGEPCCNWNIIEYCVNKAKGMYPFDFVIITNSTLLNNEKVKFIKENDIGIGISIDGTKDITDLHRKFVNGFGSVYDRTIEEIKILKKENIKLALSVTITEQFLEQQEEILDLFEKIGIDNINYNLLHSHSKVEQFDIYYSRATDFLIYSYERLHKKGIMDDRILRKINTFINDIFYYADCGAAYANQIVVKPDGMVGICQGECFTHNHEIGNIISDDFSSIYNSKDRLKWKKDLPIYNDYCLNCEAISICGGGCILQAKEIGKLKNNNNIDSAFCIHTKKLLFWLLQKLYDVS